MYSITFDDEDLELSDQILKIYNSSNPELLTDIDLNNIIILNSLGLYYEIVIPNEILMKKYYEMGIKNNGICCMICLGFYYQTNNNYDKAKEYFMMGVERGNSRSMMYLADIYKKEQNYNLMEKYYLMAIEIKDKDGILSMVKLAIYYQNIKRDFELLKKYYLMAIELGSTDAMFNLGSWYNSFVHTKYMIEGCVSFVLNGNYHYEYDVDLMNKYYLMAIENGCFKALSEIRAYYNKDNNYLEYYNIIISIKNKNKQIIDEIEKLKLEHLELINS